MSSLTSLSQVIRLSATCKEQDCGAHLASKLILGLVGAHATTFLCLNNAKRPCCEEFLQAISGTRAATFLQEETIVSICHYRRCLAPNHFARFYCHHHVAFYGASMSPRSFFDHGPHRRTEEHCAVTLVYETHRTRNPRSGASGSYSQFSQVGQHALAPHSRRLLSYFATQLVCNVF